MIDDLANRFMAYSTSHRQAIVDMVLQNLKSTVARLRLFHRGSDFRNLLPAAKPALFTLLHVVLGVKHRLLDPFVRLDLGMVLTELSNHLVIRPCAKPFGVIAEILLEDAKQTRTFSLSHAGLHSNYRRECTLAFLFGERGT